MSDAASIETLAGEAAEWRREIHRHPGIGFDVGPTASLVAGKLRAFGFDEVLEGVGRTGVVGVLRGRRDPGSGGDRAIALRADMDALPIHEQTNLGHASREAGRMHACGHDGHTAMLLGAAKHLSGARDFAGTAVFLFQPAEETSEGALAMIERRAVRPRADRQRLRAAQPAGPAGRPFRDAARPGHGLGRPLRGADRGARRPRRHAAPGGRRRAGGEPDRGGAAVHRVAQPRSAGARRGDGGRDPGRRRLQRAARHGAPARHLPGADGRVARRDRAAAARGGGGRGAAPRRRGADHLRPHLARHREPRRRGRGSRRGWRRAWPGRATPRPPCRR